MLQGSADSHRRPGSGTCGPQPQAQPQPLPLRDDLSVTGAANRLDEQLQPHRVSIRTGKTNKTGSSTLTKFLSSLLRKALGGGTTSGPTSATFRRQSGAAGTATPPAHNHPQRPSSNAVGVGSTIPLQVDASQSDKPTTPALAAVSLSHLHPSLPALFASAAQAFDTAATRLIACDEPVATNDDSAPMPSTIASDSTRLWHTLALHLRSTFPPHRRHLLQLVLTPIDLVPYLASLLSELALDVCQTLVPGSALAADQADALRVFMTTDTDEHVQQTIQSLAADILQTLATIHPSPLPVDTDDQAALVAACRAAARAVAGMRAVHPMLELRVPSVHAPIDDAAAAASVQWVGMDIGRDMRPGGRKVVREANLVAYVVFPGVGMPTGVDLPDEQVPDPVVGAYHDPQAYLAGRKRDLFAMAMAAKAAAASAHDAEHVSDLEKAMMAHWHHLHVECEDHTELERQRRRADEELILANAYGAQMTLCMADGIDDG